MKKQFFFDSTRDENGYFQAGWRVTKGSKYVTVESLTNWQGDRDETYRVEIAEFGNILNYCGGDYAEAAVYICNRYDPIKVGHVIQ